MGYPKAQFEQDVTEVRERIRAVRDNAKAQGIPNTRFYQELMDRITPYGVRASMSWLREQCDPDNITPPSLRKLFALKQALDEYQSQTGITAEGEATDKGGAGRKEHDPRTAGHDEVDDAQFTETLENLGKISIEDPKRAILITAKMLNRCIAHHTKAGGGVMIFLDYLRARISFSHDLALSNMPFHTMRDVRTKADTEVINPSFKTITALLYALSAIEAAHDTFPWGKDAELNETIKDIRAQQEKENNRKKKPRSLAQQNRDMILRAVGTAVIKRTSP